MPDSQKKSKQIIDSISGVGVAPDITPKGKRPFKAPGSLPMQPKGNDKCTECGTCVKQCPAQAIAADNPRKTDKKKCIACAHCITVCPSDARHFEGVIYKMAGAMFVRAFSARKEPDIYV